MKIIETDKIKEDYVRKNLLREAQLMRRLRHPNIIRLYETMKTNNLYCLVTEIAEGGELLSHVRSDFKEKRLSEATTRPFIRQLVSALYHLHSVGIVHRCVPTVLSMFHHPINSPVVLEESNHHYLCIPFIPPSMLPLHCTGL